MLEIDTSKLIGGKSRFRLTSNSARDFIAKAHKFFESYASKEPRAVVIGKHVSCYAGCSFAIGENGQCTIGDFTLLNGALIMAEEKIEIGSYCLVSWNVGIADSDFHPLEPRSV